MWKRALAIRDGSVQSSAAAAGAEGKDQSHRLSPREQLRWSVGGRRGRDGGVTRHIEKKVLIQWQRCHSSK